MEISLDAKTWHQKIDLSDAANVFAEAQEHKADIIKQQIIIDNVFFIMNTLLFINRLIN